MRSLKTKSFNFLLINYNTLYGFKMFRNFFKIETKISSYIIKVLKT